MSIFEEYGAFTQPNVISTQRYLNYQLCQVKHIQPVFPYWKSTSPSLHQHQIVWNQSNAQQNLPSREPFKMTYSHRFSCQDGWPSSHILWYYTWQHHFENTAEEMSSYRSLIHVVLLSWIFPNKRLSHLLQTHQWQSNLSHSETP